METDVEIFDGKSLSDLFKEIHQSTQTKHDLIIETIKDLKRYITSADSLALIAPIIKEYVDVLVRNDEHFLKLATIFQRIISANSYANSSVGDANFLTPEERDELIKMANKELDNELNIITNKRSNVLNKENIA